MNRFGHRLIGLGFWICTLPKLRPPFWTFPFRMTGHGALTIVNEALESKEMARRHAKPSSRKRVG